MDLLTPKFELFFDNDTNVDDKQQYDNNDWNVSVIEKQPQKKKPKRKRITKCATKKATTAVKKYKKKRQQCPHCSLSYSKREYLSKHMQSKHGIILEKKRPGRECPFFVKNINDPRPYKCDQCVKEYAKSKHLARHRRTHFEKERCDQCNEVFNNFADHMLKKHGIDLPRPFECDICHRTYRTKNHVKTHMRIHRAEWRSHIFPCNICTKSFGFSADLRKHMRTHSQNRSIICDICGDAFKSPDTLKCHLRRHTGERPYKCPLCPRAFSTSNSLDIHNRTHTGERPYQCEFCEKRFKDASTLNVHKRLHTNENPYICHLCGRRTKQASNLRSHYKHFHKNNDISGRQIRLNSRILNRFTQNDLDAQLQEVGDLMLLLERGMQEYRQEEREKSNQIEKAIEESIGAISVLPPQQKLSSIPDDIFSNLPKYDVKLEDSLSSMEDLNVEVNVKMEVGTFDAFDPVQPLMQTQTEAETEHTPASAPAKNTKYNLREVRAAAVRKDVQPKIESVFLEDGAYQAVTDVADFSIDGIKTECNSDDDADLDADQDENDWQSDGRSVGNDNADDDAVQTDEADQLIGDAGEVGEGVEVKVYKKKRQHCPKCSMSYSKREYLIKHMRKEHNSELERKRPGKRYDFYVGDDPNDKRPYKCDQCDKEYMRAKHLTRHRRTHLDTHQRCQQCNEKYRNYARHMLKKHGIKCDITTNNDELLGAAANDATATAAAAAAADATHIVDISIVNIKNEPHENETKMVMMHDVKSNIELEPQHQSESDEANWSDNDDFMQKIKPKIKKEKSSPNDELNRCIPCNRKFHDMSKHWVQYHSGIERPFECYVCHRNYKRYEHIKYHLRTHGTERNYQCHVCGDSFFLSNELRKHIMYRHQVERPFKCTYPQCKKSFKNMHALNVHTRTHSGAKPFRCTHSHDGIVCTEAFAALSSLRIHERKHTGEKPYVCQFCNKAFADCSTHKQHVRIHTGDKPYRCHLCDRRTAQAGNLKSHYRHYHKVIVKNVSMYLDPSTRTLANEDSANPFDRNLEITTYPIFDPARLIEE